MRMQCKAAFELFFAAVLTTVLSILRGLILLGILFFLVCVYQLFLPTVWIENIFESADKLFGGEQDSYLRIDPNKYLIWYSRDDHGNFVFFGGPGVNPSNGKKLIQADREVLKDWSAQREKVGCPGLPKSVTR